MIQSDVEFIEIFSAKILDRSKKFTVRKSDKTGAFKIGYESFYCQCVDVTESDRFLLLCEQGAFDSKKFGFESSESMFEFYLNFLESQAYIHHIYPIGLSYVKDSE